MADVPPSALAIPAGDGFVLLGPLGAAYVARALELAARQHRQTGVYPSPWWALLRQVVDQAAAFAYESAKVRTAVELPESGAAVSSVEVGAGQVAEILGCSQQWARSLLRRGEFASARRVGSSWVVDESEVAAWLVERSTRGEVA